MNEFKLDNQPKITTGFNTPDDYFETLSQKIAAKLPKEQPKVVPFFSRKTTWIFAAAAAVLILISLPLFNHYRQENNQLNSLDLEEYVEHHAVITDDDVAILLDNESLEELAVDLKINEEELEETISTEYDLETYLTN